MPLFSGYSDALAFRAEFLRSLAPELELLADVWMELAIPTAILHNTTQIGCWDGLALWGAERERSLAERFALLAEHDFVHPIKLLGRDEGEVKALYRAAAR